MGESNGGSVTAAAEALTRFTWERQPEAGRLVAQLVQEFLSRSPGATRLAERMRAETGTRFVDWVDSIDLSARMGFEKRIVAAGYVERPEYGRTGVRCWTHPGGVFPWIFVDEYPRSPDIQVTIKVESVADFAAANGLELKVHEPPLSRVRFLMIADGEKAAFGAVERHGFRGGDPPQVRPGFQKEVLRLQEVFRCRPRSFASEEEGFAWAESMFDDAIRAVGRHVTCDLFFAAEREYWQRRNRAAQFQKSRQDRLGLGWANHDHHTYRCSRRWFSRLIGLWEKLGFEIRERFYAGAEAGWGAQVCEQPVTGIITFNDVDLSPQELMNDFSHEPLPERQELGTVGLWCGLHGESFLEAGMHHLECQFDFASLKEQMEREAGIKVMKPFTDFAYLRQAFTEGERWPVREERIRRLLEKGQITQEQARQFRENGAIGSHLENLERNDGFKGFNQKGVSEIISKTDPRKNVVASTIA
jgi:hypothetical protein